MPRGEFKAVRSQNSSPKPPSLRKRRGFFDFDILTFGAKNNLPLSWQERGPGGEFKAMRSWNSSFSSKEKRPRGELRAISTLLPPSYASFEFTPPFHCFKFSQARIKSFALNTYPNIKLVRHSASCLCNSPTVDSLFSTAVTASLMQEQR